MGKSHGRQNNENNEDRPLVYLDDQQYEGLRSEANISVVVGRYRAFTKQDSGVILSEKQRVTFIWERVKKDDEAQLLITHIHISNIFHTKDDDKLFLPRMAGKIMSMYRKLLQNTVRIRLLQSGIIQE